VIQVGDSGDVKHVGDGAPKTRVTGGDGTPFSCNEECSGDMEQLMGQRRWTRRHELTEANRRRRKQGRMISGSKPPGQHSRSLLKFLRSLPEKFFLSLREAYCRIFPFVLRELNGHFLMPSRRETHMLFFSEKSLLEFRGAFFYCFPTKRPWLHGPIRLFFFLGTSKSSDAEGRAHKM
jgi:hypothetical protein